MRLFFEFCRAELVKLRRTRFSWVVLLCVLSSSAILVFLTWVMLNPDLSDALGLLGQKARLSFGTEAPDWALFSRFMLQFSGLGGMLLSSILLVYIFGREYNLGTAKVVFTLPRSRLLPVGAKLVVSLVWYVLLIAVLELGSAFGAMLVGLGPLAEGMASFLFEKILLISLSAYGISVFSAWIAVAAGGFFAALGYSIGALLLATVFSNTGWGGYLPWSILSLMSEAGGSAGELFPVSPFIVCVWTVLGLVLLFWHQLRVDNTQ